MNEYLGSCHRLDFRTSSNLIHEYIPLTACPCPIYLPIQMPPSHRSKVLQTNLFLNILILSIPWTPFLSRYQVDNLKVT